MIAKNIMLILIPGILANKYMIEVAERAGDEQREERGGDEGGSDFSFMKQSGQFRIF